MTDLLGALIEGRGPRAWLVAFAGGSLVLPGFALLFVVRPTLQTSMGFPGFVMLAAAMSFPILLLSCFAVGYSHILWVRWLRFRTEGIPLHERGSGPAGDPRWDWLLLGCLLENAVLYGTAAIVILGQPIFLGRSLLLMGAILGLVPVAATFLLTWLTALPFFKHRE